MWMTITVRYVKKNLVLSDHKCTFFHYSRSTDVTWQRQKSISEKSLKNNAIKENCCTIFLLSLHASNALSLTVLFFSFQQPSSFRKLCNYLSSTQSLVLVMSQIKCHFNDHEWVSSYLFTACLSVFLSNAYIHFTIEN